MMHRELSEAETKGLARLLDETLIPLIQAREHLPKNASGKKKSPATLWRWSRHGFRGKILETLKIGTETYTSVEAIRRFVLATNSAGSGPHAAGQTSAAVERQLDAMGC